MLTLNQISYRWPGAATDCLCDISLQLKQGEWLALTGDNGAGKSTLLRVMAGLLTPTAGTVMLQQQAMKNLKNRQRAAKIGVLFQEAEISFFTAPLLTKSHLVCYCKNARRMKSLNVPMLPCNAVS